MNDPSKDRGSFGCVVMKDGPTRLFFDITSDKASAFVLAHHGQVQSIYPSSSPVFARTAESGRSITPKEATNG